MLSRVKRGRDANQYSTAVRDARLPADERREPGRRGIALHA